MKIAISNIYFDHSNFSGSISFITDATGIPTQHLQYLPFGELFVEQRDNAHYYTPYKFIGKEKDEETGYSYFGARYLNSDISIWNSVDPMGDKYPNISPYNYCHWNSVKLIDPNGMNDIEVEILTQKDGTVKWNYMSDKGGKDVLIVNFSKEKANGDHIQEQKPIAISKPSKNSSSSTTSNSSSSAPNQSSSSNNAQTTNTVVTVGGLVADAARQIVKNPTVGYNIAYNSTLLKGVNYLKPLGYWATGASFVSDVYLTSTGQQSLGETGLNTAVTGVALGVGGWPGLIIQANYQASKAYMKTIMKHPEWAPYPSNGFRH